MLFLLQKTSMNTRSGAISQSSNKKPDKVRTTNKKHSSSSAVHQNKGDRHSIFTGKSIEIVTKNDKLPKVRESFVKGISFNCVSIFILFLLVALYLLILHFSFLSLCDLSMLSYSYVAPHQNFYFVIVLKLQNMNV